MVKPWIVVAKDSEGVMWAVKSCRTYSGAERYARRRNKWTVLATYRAIHHTTFEDFMSGRDTPAW